MEEYSVSLNKPIKLFETLYLKYLLETLENVGAISQCPEETKTCKM